MTEQTNNPERADWRARPDGVCPAWRMYKTHPGHLLALAFVIYLGAAVIAALLARAWIVGSGLAFIVEIIAAFLLQAALVKAVQDVRDGRADVSIGETVSAATPYILSVFAGSGEAGAEYRQTP